MAEPESLDRLEPFAHLHAIATRLVEVIRAEHRVLGAAFYGSVGRNRMDQFSDLDLFCVVPDEELAALLADRDVMVDLAGPVISRFVAKAEYPRILVVLYEGPAELNMKLIPRSQFEARPGEHGWLIIKDEGGLLSVTEAAARSLPKPLPAKPDDPDAKFWLWIYRTVVRVERGELWHAWDQLNDVRELLMNLTTQESGRGYLGVREWAATLDRADHKWLAATVTRLDSNDLLRGLGAAVGYYTTLRARGGWAPSNAKFEGHVKRVLQSSATRQMQSD